jgi:hypothetical protein
VGSPRGLDATSMPGLRQRTQLESPLPMPLAPPVTGVVTL